MTKRAPVVALGFDAMEGPLVESLVAQGRMPNLSALRARGTRAEVRSRPKGFLSMVWPTFITGQTLGAHGWYFNKPWSRKDQRLRFVDPSWIPIEPFWNDVEKGFRMALLDVPFSTSTPTDLNGVFLGGWQAHDDFGTISHPPGLHAELRRKFGAPAMGPEIFGPQNRRTLERQRKEGLESLHQFARIVRDFLSRERWDLLVAVFGGSHRAAHYLWSLDEADLSGTDEATRARLAGARDEIYEAADRALGEVLAAVPPDGRILVFALHGMERNPGWPEHFPAMVRHLHARGRGAAPRVGLVYRIKKALPWNWVRQVTMRLPSSIKHSLVPLWSRKMLDWSATKFFALPVDLNGYLRVNLRGRDAAGIVDPGKEYEALIEQLSKEFLSFRDMRDGGAIVSTVERVDDLVGKDAPRRSELPDLVVRWTDRVAHGCPGLKSCYGTLALDPLAPLPSGRSGNHTPGGWLVAAGPGIAPDRTLSTVDSADLPATLLAWMGANIPDRFEGRPIPELAGYAEETLSQPAARGESSS
ncbi:MAG: alkaline phosphatase family protein [Gemmatimonadota bacterium]